MSDKPTLGEFADGESRRSSERLRTQLRQTEDALDDALGRLAVLEGIDRLQPRPPRWTLKKKPKTGEAVVVAMLSDCHFDEIVRPEDVADMILGGVGAGFSDAERQVIETAARHSIRRLAVGYSAMSSDFFQAVPPNQQVETAQGLFSAAIPMSAADRADVEKLQAFAAVISSRSRCGMCGARTRSSLALGPSLSRNSPFSSSFDASCFQPSPSANAPWSAVSVA